VKTTLFALTLVSSDGSEIKASIAVTESQLAEALSRLFQREGVDVDAQDRVFICCERPSGENQVVFYSAEDFRSEAPSIQ
jgi:hypothetical protein